MNRNSFLEKITRTITYCNDYERVTIFELSELFGSSLFIVLILLMTPFFFIFSTQWVVLPLAALTMMCAIWYNFDQKLWLPNPIKRQVVASNQVKKWATRVKLSVEQWLQFTGQEATILSYWTILRPLNIALIILAAFLVGFVPATSFWPAFSLLFMALALLLHDGYLSLLGYTTLIIALW